MGASNSALRTQVDQGSRLAHTRAAARIGRVAPHSYRRSGALVQFGSPPVRMVHLDWRTAPDCCLGDAIMLTIGLSDDVLLLRHRHVRNAFALVLYLRRRNRRSVSRGPRNPSSPLSHAPMIAVAKEPETSHASIHHTNICAIVIARCGRSEISRALR